MRSMNSLFRVARISYARVPRITVDTRSRVYSLNRVASTQEADPLARFDVRNIRAKKFQSAAKATQNNESKPCFIPPPLKPGPELMHALDNELDLLFEMGDENQIVDHLGYMIHARQKIPIPKYPVVLEILNNAERYDLMARICSFVCSSRSAVFLRFIRVFHSPISCAMRRAAC